MTASLPPDVAAPLSFEQLAALRIGDRIGCWYTAAHRGRDGWIGPFTVTGIIRGAGSDANDTLVLVTIEQFKSESFAIHSDDIIAWPLEV